MTLNTIVSFIFRLVLGTIFIIASIDKIAAPDAFAASVQAYHLAPYALVNLIALVLPWIELLCGTFLIAGVYVRGSSLMVSLLLGMFVIAMISALMRHLNIDCGCFG